MWTLHTANEEHWVPISTVASFKRMREFESLGLPWIVDALKLSEELEVDSTGEKVRRRTEVKEPAGQFERSIYAVSLQVFRIAVMNEWFAERLWEGGSDITGKTRGIFQQIRADQRGADATR